MCEKVTGQCPCMPVPGDDDESVKKVTPTILIFTEEELQKMFNDNVIPEVQGTPLPIM